MSEVVIKSYDTLKKYVDLLKEGDIKLLCVIGKGGVGKSCFIEECLREEDYGYITAHATPLNIYRTAYEYRNKLLVFDDVANLTLHDDCLALLRQIADTKPVNEVYWGTTSNKLKDIPHRFTTTSRVCIIANYFKKPNPIVLSFLDRGVLLRFDPSIEELFSYAEKNICKNKDESMRAEIIQKLKEISPFCKNISLRLITACMNMYKKLSQEEFQDFVVQQGEICREAQEFLRLKDTSTSEALAKWLSLGYPERTYYHYKKLYLENPLLKE